MADFHKAFEAIDEDGSGEITVEELQHYMMKNNYKASFVSKWLTLFDGNKSGKITYQHYCETLGLIPRDREIASTQNVKMNEEVIKPTVTSKESSSKNDKDPNYQQNSETKLESQNKLKSNKTESLPTQRSDKVKTVATESSKSKEKMAKTTEKKDASSLDRKSEIDKETKVNYNHTGKLVSRLKRKNKSFSQHKRSLRKSIKPGVILILLSGIHRGKRVIFLKQLKSGLLLVTGPYKLNGCPIRRVHQKMVIATKTRLNIDNVEIPEHINDEYFVREEKDSKNRKKTSSDVTNIFAKSKKQCVLKVVRKEDQKNLDKQILDSIKMRDDKSMLAKYLKCLFSLSSHDLPHKMQF